MHFFDIQIDFFVPLWRRIALVVVCLGWAVLEFYTGAPFWGVIFGGLGVYSLWQHFFDGWPASRESSALPPSKSSD